MSPTHSAHDSLRCQHGSMEIRLFVLLYIKQGTSGAGVKRAKSESWERSVGTLSSGGALGSLVVRKKPPSAGAKPSVAATAASTSPAGKISPASHPPSGTLSLVQSVNIVFVI